MNRKLTLSLDQDAIESGKRFATSNGTSLSRMVESFFVLLDDDEVVESLPVSDKLMSLVGIGAGPASEEDYRRHLETHHA